MPQPLVYFIHIIRVTWWKKCYTSKHISFQNPTPSTSSVPDAGPVEEPEGTTREPLETLSEGQTDEDAAALSPRPSIRGKFFCDW